MVFKTTGNKSNSVILFFHAMGVTGESSMPVAEKMAEKYYCIMPTSTVYCSGQRYQSKRDEIQQIVRFLGNHGIKEIELIVASSIGADLAMAFLTETKITVKHVFFDGGQFAQIGKATRRIMIPFLYIAMKSLYVLFGTNEETNNGICEIAIGSLHPFPNHPFQVKDDKKMEELSESITQYGVLVPGIVRLRGSGGYELVAGHRRKRACELAGLEKMPVIIKDLTDDEATVIMVDSNIQREELLISEKAFAYKMKYEALKRQGKRSDLTSCQVGKKLAAEEVSQNTGDSSRQILRYIHLTELITELLELADEKKLPFNTAVEVSYLRSEEQQILLQYMSNHNMVPSMKQAKELKQISKERMLTYSEIDQICMNESTEKVQVQIPAKKLKQYFPETYTKTQMEEIIFKLLASWAEREGKE